MTRGELQAILSEHVKWVRRQCGKRANLSRADLSGANLSRADLSRADLSRADLSRADLCEADLGGADLSGADLSGANLSRADLSGADLSGADLGGANLSGADLSRADLSRADLSGADLSNTCLDPDNIPNSLPDFTGDGHGFVIGYRTEKAGHIDRYRVARFYSADVFSTSYTECHPGLYLWPTLKQARAYSGNVPMIKVRTRLEAIHKAGNKYRCQWFEVMEVIK